MNLDDLAPERNLGKDYTEHKIFDSLRYYSNFYDSLSNLIFNWGSQGTTNILNLDSRIYDSIAGTIDSILVVLAKGRINDAYALLRKYFDSTTINTYINIYLEDNCNLENFIVEKIENWRKGKERMPEYRQISYYILNSEKLKPLNELLKKDDRYSKIRDRCNDNTHYNYYRNVILNDSKIHNPDRIKYLDRFLVDIDSLFIRHFAYIFYINDHYLMASDYTDYMDNGMSPPDGSQAWVANFIQGTFDNIIKINRPDIADEIKAHSNMDLQ